MVAHDEEARSCIRSHEPIVLDEGLLNIDHMLEEEILLSLLWWLCTPRCQPMKHHWSNMKALNDEQQELR